MIESSDRADCDSSRMLSDASADREGFFLYSQQRCLFSGISRWSPARNPLCAKRTVHKELSRYVKE